MWSVAPRGWWVVSASTAAMATVAQLRPQKLFPPSQPQNAVPTSERRGGRLGAMKRLGQSLQGVHRLQQRYSRLDPRLEVGPGSPSVPGFLELSSGAHAPHQNLRSAKSSSQTSNSIARLGQRVFWGTSAPNLADDPRTLTARQPAPSRLSRGRSRAPVTAAEIQVP